jgi:hypothetical protein
LLQKYAKVRELLAVIVLRTKESEELVKFVGKEGENEVVVLRTVVFESSRPQAGATPHTVISIKSRLKF